MSNINVLFILPFETRLLMKIKAAEIQKFVVYFFPGFQQLSKEYVEVEIQDISTIDFPKEACCLRFAKQHIITVVDESGKEIETTSIPEFTSKYYYIDAEILSADEVRERMKGESDYVLANVERSLEQFKKDGVTKIVLLRNGTSAIPYDEGIVVHSHTQVK